VGTERGERVIVLVIVLSVIPNGWYHTQGRLGTIAEAIPRIEKDDSDLSQVKDSEHDLWGQSEFTY